jgi:hypothetical protein
LATIDDVHELLRAVNEETLKRMEDKIDATHELLRAVNEETLKRMEDKIDALA